MSFDFYFDPVANDLRIQDGDIIYSRGVDTIVQQIKCALSTDLGEWYLDTTKGVPYYSATGQQNDGTKGILGSNNYSAAEISAIMRKVILEVPGVEAVTELNIGDPNEDRLVKVQGTVTASFDNINGVGTQTLQNVTFRTEIPA